MFGFDLEPFLESAVGEGHRAPSGHVAINFADCNTGLKVMTFFFIKNATVLRQNWRFFCKRHFIL